MSTTPFATSHQTVMPGGDAAGHLQRGASIPARHPNRRFVAAPVAPTGTPQQNSAIDQRDDLATADAVLALLRSVNSNPAR